MVNEATPRRVPFGKTNYSGSYPFVRYSLYHAWEENIACKNVHSIKQIGFSALQRVFGNKGNLHGEYFRMFAPLKDSFDLNSLAVNKPCYNLEMTGKGNKHTEGDMTFEGGTDYMIWSIILGLKKLPSESRPVLYEITRAIRESKEVPSHFLIREWESVNGKVCDETYYVFSLSEEQQLQIKNSMN